MAGEQKLVVKVEFATQELRATATGTAVRYTPASVAAGDFATCAIALEGLVSCWGEEPKVGDSSIVNKPAPTRTSSQLRFLSVVASPTSPGRFCGVAFDQSILCWGINALSDTAGRGTIALVPTPVPMATQAFTQVAPGFIHTCALSTDQSVYCWGDNTRGQLGDRLVKSRQAPAVVYGGFKFMAVSSGSFHTCGLSVDGAVFCWGLNQSGQLGNGNTQSNSSPVAVTGALTFKQISAGQSFTCALTTLGRPYCWGNLVTGSTAVLTPRTYTTAPDFTARVTLGGQQLASEKFAGRSLAVVTKKIPMEELLAAAKAAGKGQAPLVFATDGTGLLTYGALLRYAPAALPAKPRDEGLFVQRWFEPYDQPGKVATEFGAGELVRVRLRVATRMERHFVAVDVPLPAGLEAVDTQLATASHQVRETNEEQPEGGEGAGEEGYDDNGQGSYGFWSPFNYSEKRDDRVVYFADDLPPGVHVQSFIARATTPGKFLLKPAQAEEMYTPEVFGRSEGGTLTVTAQRPLTQK